MALVGLASTPGLLICCEFVAGIHRRYIHYPAGGIPTCVCADKRHICTQWKQHEPASGCWRTLRKHHLSAREAVFVWHGDLPATGHDILVWGHGNFSTPARWIFVWGDQQSDFCTTPADRRSLRPDGIATSTDRRPIWIDGNTATATTASHGRGSLWFYSNSATTAVGRPLWWHNRPTAATAAGHGRTIWRGAVTDATPARWTVRSTCATAEPSYRRTFWCLKHQYRRHVCAVER